MAAGGDVVAALSLRLDALHAAAEKELPSERSLPAALLAERDAILGVLDALPVATSSASKALVALLRGRALDAGPEFVPAAEALLSRAVKLEPQSADAWAALGRCALKKGDLRTAAECYASSHKRRASPSALRALSYVARSLAAQLARGSGAHASSEVVAERDAAYRDSVDKAKAAVALGVGDPESWASLGVASLYLALHVTHDDGDMARAKGALAQAAKLEDAAVGAGGGGGGAAAPVGGGAPGGDVGSGEETAAAGGASAAGGGAAAAEGDAAPSAKGAPRSRNPDLHFNRGMVLAFLSEWAEAVASFQMAAAIDPSLPCKVRSLWHLAVSRVRAHHLYPPFPNRSASTTFART